MQINKLVNYKSKESFKLAKKVPVLKPVMKPTPCYYIKIGIKNVYRFSLINTKKLCRRTGRVI